MKILVKILAGSTFEFEANEKSTLGDLKDAFEKKKELNRMFYKFILNNKGSFTNDDPKRNLIEFLKSYGMDITKNEIVINCIFRFGPSEWEHHVKIGSRLTPYSTATPDSLCQITTQKIKEFATTNKINKLEIFNLPNEVITSIGIFSIKKYQSAGKPIPSDSFELDKTHYSFEREFEDDDRFLSPTV